MRILIISDSHGRTENIEILKKKIGKLDLILYCGDGSSDFDYIGDRSSMATGFRISVTGS